ncbi:hypothetical protein C8F01DRAFT_1154212 [Mycena amicta]|nr:hypothetical protein C8F01DRAFT_1154212 [Mycena amicta]
MAAAVRRKPAPVVDIADLDDHASTLPSRHSFALYASSPLAQATQPVHITSSPPHYTRRRTQSSIASSPPPTSTSTRARLARLLLHQPRKLTISGPSPVEFPTDLLPAELVAFKASTRPMVLVDLPVPPDLASPASTHFSSSTSSRCSGETHATTPPVSPTDSKPPSEIDSATSSVRNGPADRSWSVDGHSVSLVGATLPRAAHTASSLRARSLGKLSTSPSEFSRDTCASSLDGHTLDSSPRRRPSVLKKSPSLSASLNSKHSAPSLPLALPTTAALARAAQLPLVSPNGIRVPFGVLLGMPRESLDLGASAVGVGSDEHVRRTLVVFLRHFWCPNCQDYLVALAGGVGATEGGCNCQGELFLEHSIESTKEVENDTHLLLIAPGSHTLAGRYLDSFKFPLQSIASVRIFVDPMPAEGVYAALGMGWDGAIPPVLSSPVDEVSTCGQETFENSAGHGSMSLDEFADPDAAPTSYITHGTLSGIGSVLLRCAAWGVRFRVRVGSSLLFFCAHGSLRCTYAHRMQNPRGHASVERVLAAAGMRVSSPVPGSMGSWRWRKKGLAATISRSVSALVLPQSTSTSEVAEALPRSASVVGVCPSAIPASPSTIPRSESYTTSSGGFFHRFAGPRGGRPPTKQSQTREHASIPRSASTPATMALFARAAERVSVILEGIHEDESQPQQGKREAAIPPTLSASSSRPWALAGAANSCESLVSSISFRSVTFTTKAQSQYTTSSAMTEEDNDLDGYMSGDEADDEGKPGVAFPLKSLGSASDCGHAVKSAIRTRIRTSSESTRQAADDADQHNTWEDVWMRARALSLVRLKARKDVRRGVVGIEPAKASF